MRIGYGLLLPMILMFLFSVSCATSPQRLSKGEHLSFDHATGSIISTLGDKDCFGLGGSCPDGTGLFTGLGAKWKSDKNWRTPEDPYFADKFIAGTIHYIHSLPVEVGTVQSAQLEVKIAGIADKGLGFDTPYDVLVNSQVVGQIHENKSKKAWEEVLTYTLNIDPEILNEPSIKVTVTATSCETKTPCDGYAIDYSELRVTPASEVAAKEKKKGGVITGWLGVNIQKVTLEIKEKFGLKTKGGALIAEVTRGSPAEKGGLKRGDVIVSFDGKKVREVTDLPPMVVATPVGKKVEIVAIRRGWKKRLVLKIGRLKEQKGKRPLSKFVDVDREMPALGPKTTPVAKPTKIEIEPVAEKPAKIEKLVTLPKIGKNYAVVIGIRKYQDDRIPELKYTTVDAEEIYNILTDPQYGNFPKNQVKLLIDEQATDNNIKSAIGTWLRRNTRKDDTVIIFFAGHGAPEDEKTYWVTYNANIDDLYGTALSNDEIADMLDRVEANKMIALLDSCYSAATVNRTDKKRSIIIVKDPFQKFKGKGRVIITSSDGEEQSLEVEKFGHGVFTYHLVKALKGEADENKDGFVELDEVWDYVKYRVSDTARKHGSTQTPIIDGSYSAGVVLSKHPERLRELELEAGKEKKEKELELKIAKLTELYSKGEITDSQFDKAVGMLKSGQKNKLLDSFLSGKISLTTFQTVFK